jgi:ABC transporter substrate binding protein
VAPREVTRLIDALKDLGRVETQNLIIDYRYAERRSERLPAPVADLLRAKPDIIYAEGDQQIQAVKDAIKTVPIVMVACDAVAEGLIASSRGMATTGSRSWPSVCGSTRSGRAGYLLDAQEPVWRAELVSRSESSRLA